jgi:hypothetical protein
VRCAAKTFGLNVDAYSSSLGRGVRDERSGEGECVRHVLEGAEHRDGGVVDEHVDAVLLHRAREIVARAVEEHGVDVLLHRARDDLARRGLVHVERHPDPARALELGVLGCGTHGIARRGEDLLAALERRERECKAETAGRAGDEPARAGSDRGDRC